MQCGCGKGKVDLFLSVFFYRFFIFFYLLKMNVFCALLTICLAVFTDLGQCNVVAQKAKYRNKVESLKAYKGQTIGFEMPSNEVAAYVKLLPKIPMDFSDFTIDIFFIMKGGETGTTIHDQPHLVSYATSWDRTNTLVIGLTTMAWCQTTLTKKFTYNVPKEEVFNRFLNKLTRYTLVVKGIEKHVEFYINGEQVPSSDLTNSLDECTLTPDGIFILGQEQESLGGSFAENQRFIGTYEKFQMWNFALTGRQLNNPFLGFFLEKGNVFDFPVTYEYELNDGAKSVSHGAFSRITWETVGFEMPSDKDGAYVKLHPKIPLDFSDFTIDIFFIMKGGETGTRIYDQPYLVSYATSNSANGLVIGLTSMAWCQTTLTKTFTYNVPKEEVFDRFLNKLTRYTLVVKGIEKHVEFYINGEKVPSSDLENSLGECTMTPDGIFILGQEQDSLGGSFSKPQRFVGTYKKLQMWDSALNSRQLKNLFLDLNVPKANVFDFPPTYAYELKGGATIA